MRCLQHTAMQSPRRAAGRRTQRRRGAKRIKAHGDASHRKQKNKQTNKQTRTFRLTKVALRVRSVRGWWGWSGARVWRAALTGGFQLVCARVGLGVARARDRHGQRRHRRDEPERERPNGTRTRPSGTRTRPSGTRPSGTRPSGTRPSGTRPSGTRPSGTRPSGTYVVGTR